MTISEDDNNEGTGDKDGAEKKRHDEGVENVEAATGKISPRRRDSTISTTSGDSKSQREAQQNESTSDEPDDSEPDEHVARFLRERKRKSRLASILSLPTIKEKSSNQDDNASSSGAAGGSKWSRVRGNVSEISQSGKDPSTLTAADKIQSFIRRLQSQQAGGGGDGGDSGSWQAFLQRNVQSSSGDPVATEISKEQSPQDESTKVSEPDKNATKSETTLTTQNADDAGTSPKPSDQEETSSTPSSETAATDKSRDAKSPDRSTISPSPSSKSHNAPSAYLIDDSKSVTEPKPDDNVSKTSETASQQPESPKSEIKPSPRDKERATSVQSNTFIKSTSEVKNGGKQEQREQGKLSIFALGRLKNIFSKKKKTSQATNKSPPEAPAQIPAEISGNSKEPVSQTQEPGGDIKPESGKDEASPRTAWEENSKKPAPKGDFKTKVSKISAKSQNKKVTFKTAKAVNGAKSRAKRRPSLAPSKSQRSSIASLDSISENHEPGSDEPKNAGIMSKIVSTFSNSGAKQEKESPKPTTHANAPKDHQAHQKVSKPRRRRKTSKASTSTAKTRAKAISWQPPHPFSVNTQMPTIHSSSSQPGGAMVAPVMMMPPMMYSGMYPTQMMSPYGMPSAMMYPTPTQQQQKMMMMQGAGAQYMMPSGMMPMATMGQMPVNQVPVMMDYQNTPREQKDKNDKIYS